MRSTLFTLIVLLYSSKLFAQDIDLSKGIQEKRKTPVVKVKHPFEFEFGYGGLLNSSDTITATVNFYNPDTLINYKYSLDTVGYINNLLFVGVNKQVGKLRYSIKVNYINKSFEKNDFINDWVNTWGSYVDSHNILASNAVYKMNVLNPNFNLEYLILDNKKTSIFLGGGIGYQFLNISNSFYRSQNIESLNLTTNETIVVNDVYESQRFYKNTGLTFNGNIGTSYRVTSKLKANMSFYLLTSLNKKLSYSGNWNYYNSEIPFQGIWQENGLFSNVKYGTDSNGNQVLYSETENKFQNPLQFGLKFSISYSFDK